jgi:hypothetical protein
MANQQRFYREVNSLDDAKTAIKELTDNQYSMRDQINQHKTTIDGHEKTIAGHKQTIKQMQQRQSSNDNLQGIKIKGITSPGTGGLANGMTLKYNSASGQFEFSS